MQHDSRQDGIPPDEWQAEAERSRHRRLHWRLVGLQALVLVPLIYLWMGPASEVAAASTKPDLAAGLVGMLLMVLGLPWTVFVCLLDNHYALFDSGARDLFVVGPALANLALTSFGAWWTGRHPVAESEWQVIEVDEDEPDDAEPDPDTSRPR